MSDFDRPPLGPAITSSGPVISSTPIGAAGHEGAGGGQARTGQAEHGHTLAVEAAHSNHEDRGS